MPAKGSIGKFHGRHPLISKKLWKKYIIETGNKLPYKEFLEIIYAEVVEIKKWVFREPIGYQLSPVVGNLAINRFMPANDDFQTYHYNGGQTKIKNHNLHTGGAVFKIQWFYAANSHQSRLPYWFFKASREFNRDLAKILKSGNYPNYNSYMQDYFVQKNIQCKS